MKKILSIMVITCLFFINLGTKKVYANSTSIQAAWITTVYNKDWPKVKNNISTQKQEMISILDELNNVGIDTIMFQVRTQGDALYKSNINPWSSVLTGTQGKDPGYDPLEFVISEAKKRGMKVHAWLNPYRATTSGTDTNSLSSNHQARKNPSWTISYDGRLYFNPELPQVKQYIVDTVAEIVSNYDVDGIHFDDYFYPENYPLPNGESKDGAVANARRSHITDMIKAVKNKIKSIDSSVEFGISPSGVWKNKSSDSNGSNTYGAKESYYSDFADTRYWVKNNLVDYIVPQIYWERSNKTAPYENVVSWWNETVKGTNVDLYIGQGIYKDVVASEIYEQLNINKNYSQVNGSVYFTTSDITSNRQNCKTNIIKFLKENLFSDVKGHWAYDTIKDFTSKGYINGYNDKTFRPDNNMTRAEFVKVLNKVFGLTKSSGKVFSDTSNHWAKNEIDIAVTNGICIGKSSTEFKPDDYITREEAAVMVARYKKIEDNNFDKLNKYSDKDEVSTWAKAGLEGNIEKGYVQGYSDNTIRPKNNITRAEAVVLLSRAEN